MNAGLRKLGMAVAIITAGAHADNFGTGPNQFTMDFVLIGNTENAPDSGGWGSVAYEYRIGAYEVSIAEFTKVYNTDNRVGDGDEDYWNDGVRTVGTNAPVSHISWIEAARFCNWLTSGDAYSGAYEFNGSGVLTGINRALAMSTYEQVYVIPNEDEWYKAAYYKPINDGSYSVYSTGLNSTPLHGTTAGWNYDLSTDALPAPSFPWTVENGGLEQNGTRNMNGNVWEWIEAALDYTLEDMTESRILRGAGYNITEAKMQASKRNSWGPENSGYNLGLRVVALASSAPPPDGPNVTISNLAVAQRVGTKLVDVSYDIVSSETNEVAVALVVSHGISAVTAVSLTGDVGTGVRPGVGKSMIWDAGADWDGSVAELLYTVSGDGGQSGVSAVAPIAKTGQATSYQTGDDGDLQKGGEWPLPRFTDHGDGTVTDEQTGLLWHKTPQIIGSKNWNSAIDYCDGLIYAGKTNWHLPTAREMMSLLDFSIHSPTLPSGHPFTGVVSSSFWTSTVTTFNTNRMWLASTAFGYLTNNDGSGFYSVWPVCAGPAGRPAPVVKTGQTTSQRPGDDGDLEEGAAWPSHRFVDNENGTMTDLLTGLDWVTSPHSLSGNTGSLPWSNAVSFCESLDYADSSDWRLPNLREMESLVHYGTGAWGDRPYEWLNSSNAPSMSIQSAYYWSGTTYAPNTDRALAVSLALGNISGFDKILNVEYAWPVRGESVVFTNATPNVKSDMVQTDTRDYSLSVTSLYGSPIPAIGTLSGYCWKSSVTGWVDRVVNVDGTNYSCSGWYATGGVPSLGNGSNFVLQLELPVSSVDWRWIADADSDQMPDDWELLYFGSKTAGVATNDADGDGYLNWQEYILGSNPTNGGSSFLFTHGTNAPPGDFSIDFTTVPGRLYTVECTDELGSGNWQVLTNFIGDGSTEQVINPVTIPACFYQIRIDWVE